MKRVALLLGTAAFCLGLVGCLQANVETEIKDDGSGSFYLAYSMSPSVAEAMKELNELGDVGGMEADMPMFGDLDKKEFKENCKKHGVTVEKFAETGKDGREGFEIALKFKDVEGLNAAMQEGMGDGSGMMLARTEDGNYVFQLLTGDEEESEDEGMFEESSDMTAESEEEAMSTPEEDFNPEDFGKAMEIMGKLMGSITELEFSMRITVPGEVIESTAPTVEGRTSIWNISGADIMGAQPDMDEPRILFSGKGLNIKAPELDR